MRSRLPLILIALTILFAFVASGCGDDKSISGDSATPAATQSTGGEAVNGSAAETLDNCLETADVLPESQVTAAKQRCQDTYDKIKDASGKIDKATRDARDQCQEAANKITVTEAKTAALQACAQFK